MTVNQVALIELLYGAVVTGLAFGLAFIIHLRRGIDEFFEIASGIAIVSALGIGLTIFTGGDGIVTDRALHGFELFMVFLYPLVVCIGLDELQGPASKFDLGKYGWIIPTAGLISFVAGGYMVYRAFVLVNPSVSLLVSHGISVLIGAAVVAVLLSLLSFFEFRTYRWFL